MKVRPRTLDLSLPRFRDEPFLLLKKFTPICVLAEDRDGADFYKEHESFVYLFTMEYVTSRTTSLCVSIHMRAFTQVAE